MSANYFSKFPIYSRTEFKFRFFNYDLVKVAYSSRTLIDSRTALICLLDWSDVADFRGADFLATLRGSTVSFAVTTAYAF